MSYQVLARKWRPKSFQQMVGQGPILRMLTNALDQQRLHHAYLLTGTRGVGKTTLGRILAKCLNCERGITSTPCEQCKNCCSIDAGQFLDLQEIDAASRTKIEDTRELLDNVHYQPVQGRYKVYLIDEVHMLSGHSFNALLKTLEEPPPYVKFILATTDPKRLPVTILSRCLQFHLKHVLPAHIAEHLQTICQAEQVQYEAPALTELAQAAEGSLRDALSLLDQAIAYCGHEVISTQNVRQMLGCIEQETLHRLLHALAKQDGTALLSEINRLGAYITDFNQVLEDLLSFLHRICIAQTVPDAIGPEGPLNELMTLFTAEEIQLYYQIALIGRRDLPLAPSLQQGFEMVMLRMLAFKPMNDDSPPLASPLKICPSPAAPQASPPTSPAVAMPSAPPPPWAEMLPQLGLTGMAYALAANCVLDTVTPEIFSLTLSAQYQPMYNKKLAERIEQALHRYLNAPVKLEIKISQGANIETPTQQQQQAKTAQQNAAHLALKNDGMVQKIIKTFGATLEIDSIKIL